MTSEERLQNLLDRHFDEALTVDEAAELNAGLAASESARDQFWLAARIHARLRQWGEQQVGLRRAGESALARRDVPSRGPGGWQWTAAMSGAAALVLVCLGAFLWQRPTDERLRTAARFGSLENARWIGTKVYREGDAIHAGQRVEIAGGKARIDFASGAEVTLLGPAVFDVESEKSAYLALGRLSARADTPASHGFTIRTRTARVVDRGTEFSAEAAADGQSRVGVLSGSVEVTAADKPHLLRPGDMLLVEPGAARVVVRIERGDGTPAFRFPTIEPPSDRDYADARQGRARITVARGKLAPSSRLHPDSGSGPVEALLNGRGQTSQDAPHESVFFQNNSEGMLLLDLGSVVSVSKINTYSWHQNRRDGDNRLRAQQQYVLYGSAGETSPPVDGPLEEAGWVPISRVNTDEFFGVASRLDRPAQQVCSITSATGTLGRYRYLLWEVKPNRFPDYRFLNHTFYGEFDVYTRP